MGTDILPNVGCSVIGLSEVENDKVLTDLTNQPELKARNYKYCHIEGPDARGIDCALLYNPKMFKVDNMKLVPYVQKELKDSSYKTRGFLTISGKLADEHVVFIVCHLPSRFILVKYQCGCIADRTVYNSRVLRVITDNLITGIETAGCWRNGCMADVRHQQKRHN